VQYKIVILTLLAYLVALTLKITGL